jgi:S1-C subfamily serine protease
MSVIYDPPVSAGHWQPRPPEGWPGAGGPPGPGGPPGYGGGGNDGGRHVRHPSRGLLILGAIAAAGLAAFLGLQAAAAGPGSTVLSTSQIAAKVDPALVDVNTTLGYQQGQAAGTGLVLTPNGEVLTNNHVIEGATKISVTDVGNGRTYPAKVVGYDQTHDIAVLQLQGASGLQTVTLGNSATAAVGQSVVALGNAGGQGGTPSVATGTITGLNASITASDQASGTSEQLSGLIHHNAPIQPGDSGGPLVNSAGQVIGINTAAGANSPFQLQYQSGSPQVQAFAIPVNQAKALASQVEAGHASATVHIGATGFLGVEILSGQNAAANGIQPGSGAAVAGVVPGTPAATAGLTGGDVITAVSGQHVSSPSALQSAMERHHPGDKVTISWTDQAGQTHSATVTLASGPAA